MNAEFAQIRELLERRRGELLRRVERVQRDLERADGPLSADSSEQAVEVQNDETLNAIGQSASEQVADIDEALQRLSAGEYGICKRCGQLIEAPRLAVLPESTMCARCA